MEPNEIIESLATATGFPADALRAAGERRAELTPVFIRAVEDYAAGKDDGWGDRSPVFFMFFLLGEWGETAACQPLLRLLRLPTERLDIVLGDAVSDSGQQIMGAVFDGDPQPYYDLILDPKADDFARSALFGALVVAVRIGRLDRAEAARFLARCFDTLRPKAPAFVWVGWQEAIAVLGLDELVPLVRQAFRRGYINEIVMDFSDFEGDLAKFHEDPDALAVERSMMPMGSTFDRLASWDSWGEPDDGQRPAIEDLSDALDRFTSHHAPAVNLYRHVGRNDPCPCGSGKKLKRCCLPAS